MNRTDERTQSLRNRTRDPLPLRVLWSIARMIHHKELICIRIFDVSFYREILSELMQAEAFQLRRCFYTLEPGSCCERNGIRPGENSRSVVQEDFVDDIGRQCGPIHHRSSFNHHAGDLLRAEKMDNVRQRRTPITGCGWNLLNANPAPPQLLLLFFFRQRAEN